MDHRPGAPVRRMRLKDAFERFLNTSGVRYIHVRNTEAGCFIARIERDCANARLSHPRCGPGTFEGLRYHGGNSA